MSALETYSVYTQNISWYIMSIFLEYFKHIFTLINYI